MTRPRPVLSRQGHNLECPECDRPMLFAVSVEHNATWRSLDMTTTLCCTSCGSKIVVTTPLYDDVSPKENSLAARARESTRDPEQEKRDRAADALSKMARELQAKAARVRKGELP